MIILIISLARKYKIDLEVHFELGPWLSSFKDYNMNVRTQVIQNFSCKSHTQM